MEGVELMRSRVILEKHRVTNVSSIDFPHNFPGEDLSWNFDTFKNNFDIVISKVGKDSIEFDLIGVDASIVNSLRRILIAEIPTMAIETVFVYQNNGIMHDEVMSHRFGLIPIKADPRLFQFRAPNKDLVGPECDFGPTDKNTIVFKLQVKCTKNLKALPNAVHPTDKYVNSTVTSGMLQWEPQGRQAELFNDDPIRVVNPDIVITKLRPDQEIHVDLHCQKGIGREHAKWSPVATASYRLLPDIQILEPIVGEDAVKFKKLFPEGVVDVIKNKNGEKEAKVVNPRKDTMSREVLRHKEFEKKVRLTRIRDHFIFNIESTGVLPANVLFEEACKKMIEKCRLVKNAVQNARATVAQYNQ